MSNLMLTRLALIAPPGSSQQRLRGALSRPMVYNVREFQSLVDVQASLAHFPFSVLISRLPAFHVEHVATIQRIAALFPHAGLLTVAPEIDPRARFALRNLNRHALVDEELEFADLDLLIAKVVKAREKSPSAARMHPRAKRDDGAVLITTDEAYQDDTLHDAKFVDFARMGARVVVSSTNLEVAVKSRVELRYQSSEDRKRVHRLEARVVWIKKTSPLESLLAGSKTVLGLRFVAEL